MASLRTRLRDFGKREASFGDVRSELIRVASGDERALAQARRELRKALDAGALTQEQFDSLEKALQSVVLADGGSLDSIPDAADRTDVGLIRGKPVAVAIPDDNDAPEDESDDGERETPTLDSGVFDDEETVIRPLPTLSAGGGDSAPDADDTLMDPGAFTSAIVDTEDENEETVLRPRGSPPPNFARREPESARERDPEPELVDDEATVLRPRGDPDVTAAVAGSDEHDATVLRPPDSAGSEGAGPDSDRTVAVGDSEDADQTVLATPGGDDDDDNDRTVVVPADAALDPDATVVMTGDATQAGGVDDDDVTTLNREIEDRTRVLGDDDDFDPLDASALAAAEQSLTDVTGGDQTWDPGMPTQRGPVVDRVFTKGSVLKDRFRLTDALGEGGMGTVWKAVDTLKLEAEDRNPYVAIKLLQGDFKAHPEAFIALQRESSKQQRLAHPNIATVFDFDREASSNTVFMTMEVMDGSDLADFIKTIPKGGLPYDEAMELVEQLGSGLDYAHKAGLVHSDLKPGNCFLTNDRKVKLLDFGIARASATREDAEGEETKFDPGQLGALTPSYATLEMFQGLEPDPRDDIYAMAIIAHQLFTGKHPFNRRSAPKALKEGLAVAPLDKLTKRQNRALAEGLAFERDNRTMSVEEFLDGLRVKKVNKALIALPIVAVLAIVGVGFQPLMNALDENRREAIIEAMASDRPDTIADLISASEALVDGADDAGGIEQRNLILEDSRVLDALFQQFETGEAEGVKRGLELVQRYPDALRGQVLDDPRVTAPVFALTGAGTEESIGRAFDLTELYPAELKDRTLSDERFTGTVVDMIARGDEASIATGLALADRFPARIRKQVREDSRAVDAVFALYRGRLEERFAPADGRYDIDYARAQVAELARIYPNLSTVRDVRDGVNQARDAKVSELQAELAELLEAGRLLPDADARDVGDVLDLVKQLNPASDVLSAPEIAAAYAQAANAAVAASQLERAERVLTTGLLYAPGDDTLRSLNNDVVTELKRIQDARIAREIEARLAPLWEGLETLEAFAPVRGDLQQLAEVAPASELLGTIRTRVSALFEQALGQLSGEGRWGDAQAFLLAYAGLVDLPILESRKQQLYQAASAAGQSLPAPTADAVETRVTALEQLLSAPESTRRWESALALPFKELYALLPPGDTRLSATRTRIAEVFSAQSDALVAVDNYDGAATALDRAQRFYPRWPALTDARSRLATAKTEYDRVQAERARLARIEELKTTVLDQAVANEPDAAVAALDELKQELPAADPFLAEEAPQAIGQSFARTAAIVAAREAYEEALQLIDRGLQVAPNLQQLAGERARVVDALRSRALGAQSVYAPDLPAAPTAPQRATPSSGKSLSTGSVEWAGRAGPPPVSPVDISAGVPDVRIASIPPGTIGAAMPRLLAPADAVGTKAMAEFVAAQLYDSLNFAPDAISGAQTPIDTYAILYPDAGERFRTGVAERFAESIAAAVVANPTDAGSLTESVATFGELFPGAADALEQRLTREFNAKLRELAAGASGLTTLQAPVAAFRALLPAQVPSMVETLGGPATNLLVGVAGTAGANFDALRNAVALFDEVLPEARAAMEPRLSAVLFDSIVAGLPEDIALSRTAAAVSALRELLPTAQASADQRLAPVLVTALTGRITADASLTSLAAPLSEFRRLLPEAAEDADAELAAAAGRAIVDATTPESASLAALEGRAGAYSALFPDRVAQLRQQLSIRLGEQLRNVSAEFPGDLGRLSEGVGAAMRVLGSDGGAFLAALAPAVAGDIGRAASATPGDLRTVRGAVDAFRAMFSGQDQLLNKPVADPARNSIVSTARSAILDLTPVLAPVGAFRAMFPQQVASLDERLGNALVSELREAAVANPAAPGQFAVAIGQLRELVPAAAGNVDTTVAPVFEEGLEGEMRSRPLNFASSATALDNFAALFANRNAPLRRRLSVPVVAALQGKYRDERSSMVEVERDLQAFEQVFPEQLAGLRTRVGSTVAENVTQSVRDGGLRVADGAAASVAFAALFPQQAASLKANVAQLLWGGLEQRASADLGRIGELEAPLAAFARQFPDEYARRGESLVELLSNRIEAEVRADPLALEGVRGRIADFEALFGGRGDDLRSRVQGPVIAAFYDRYRKQVPPLEEVASDRTSFTSVFPNSAGAFNGRVASIVGEAVLRDAEARQDDIRGAAALGDAYAQLFPEQAASVQADVAQIAWAAIESRADQNVGDLTKLAEPLGAYREIFPNNYDQLSGALATRAARNIQRGARDTRTALADVAGQLEQFRRLFPQQHADVAADVGGALAERISESKIDTAAQVTGLGAALRELRSLFPERHAELSDNLSSRVLQQVRALQNTDPVRASALQKSGLGVFPGNAELASIRIELPLQEVIDGKALLSKARLSAARQKLEQAQDKDPRHSTIPNFEAGLKKRETAAKEAYARYVSVVKRNPNKSEHAKAWKKVRSLWADNKAFKQLTPPAPYECTAVKAGQGQRRSCYDRVGRRSRDRGPVMVVIPAGGGIDQPFAITKQEISVRDYAFYCRASKKCRPPRLRATLPMHKISVKSIDAYASWLSKRSGKAYRLPTTAEWAHAAQAGGKQPKKDFNCTVIVGGKKLKGLSLLSTKSGLSNGWGLSNYLGNVRELVRDGDKLSARGGSYKDKLQDCSIDLSVSHSGESDDLTGFRLVRDVSQ